MIEFALVLIGSGIAIGTMAAILWSIAHPEGRLWPPQRYTAATPFLVWVPTFTLFGALVALGVLGWGEVMLPEFLRFGIGLPLIVLGNLGVWVEVIRFGIAQTGGAKGPLITHGLYRFSRNPQYVSDCAMVFGWMLVSATPLVFLVGCFAIAVLLTAPFAEEPWLEDNYGQPFRDYKATVRRYF